MKKIYRLIAVSLISALACVFFMQESARADDWDDAGKILAGVVGGYIGHEILDGMFSGSSYSYNYPRSYRRQSYYYSSHPGTYSYGYTCRYCTRRYRHTHSSRSSHHRRHR